MRSYQSGPRVEAEDGAKIGGSHQRVWSDADRESDRGPAAVRRGGGVSRHKVATRNRLKSVRDEDPFAAAPVSGPDPPTRVSAHVVVGLTALPIWTLVLFFELVDMPNVSFGVFVVPAFEAVLWLAAILLTVYLAQQVPRIGMALGVVAAITGGLATVYYTNWAAFEPRSYYALHQRGFAEIAKMVRDGELRTEHEYYGRRLPRHLADLSTTGTAAIVGRQDGAPVVFLPQFLGIPDDAIGYVYFEGQPDDALLLDLFGHPFNLTDGERLGDGWWYTR